METETSRKKKGRYRTPNDLGIFVSVVSRADVIEAEIYRVQKSLRISWKKAEALVRAAAASLD